MFRYAVQISFVLPDLVPDERERERVRVRERERDFPLIIDIETLKKTRVQEYSTFSYLTKSKKSLRNLTQQKLLVF